MSEPRLPEPAKLVASVIYRSPDGTATEELDGALARLEQRFGAADFISAPAPFTQTSYYEKEMGRPLWRRFLAFARLVDRGNLAAIKLATNAIEKQVAAPGDRPVNLDPGLLTPENLVLATGKNFGHRVYLGSGIFAEVTLMFVKGRFRPLPWTYPDYASEEIRTMFAEIRKTLLAGRQGGVLPFLSQDENPRRSRHD
ncbi:MAG: DUF4416 family protein [Thermodesulfobacteriota bacterium]